MSVRTGSRTVWCEPPIFGTTNMMRTYIDHQTGHLIGGRIDSDVKLHGLSVGICLFWCSFFQNKGALSEVQLRFYETMIDNDIMNFDIDMNHCTTSTEQHSSYLVTTDTELASWPCNDHLTRHLDRPISVFFRMLLIEHAKTMYRLSLGCTWFSRHGRLEA